MTKKVVGTLFALILVLGSSACGFMQQNDDEIRLSKKQILEDMRKDCPNCYSDAVAKQLGLVANTKKPASGPAAKPKAKPKPAPCETPKPTACESEADDILRDACQALAQR